MPLYVISPWSRGGWVNSQVFDHTSVGQFLERRFGISVPAISPWHRAVCGDLTSAFDFVTPNDGPFPALPPATNSTSVIATIAQLPKPAPPQTAERLFQESGVRRSRALPYVLHVHARSAPKLLSLILEFQNSGNAGAVFHVYDKLHLDLIPRRYTVEAGKALSDGWELGADGGRYDLWVLGPNGFVREFRGLLEFAARPSPEVELAYDSRGIAVRLVATNEGASEATLIVRANAYRTDGPWTLRLRGGARLVRQWSLISSHQWYDFTVTSEFIERRFAGRLETGSPSFSDPAV